jgi:hypothetical protein
MAEDSDDGMTNQEMEVCYQDNIAECTELLQSSWLADCHTKMEMIAKLTACTLELCGHATDELKTAGKTLMLTEFIENCKGSIFEKKKFPAQV